MTDCLGTPIRRSRRLSERSGTPLREIPEEPSEIGSNKKRSRSTTTTPRKSGRTSPAPCTPRRTRRTSGESGHTVSIMATVVEDEEEKNELYEEETQKSPKGASVVRTRSRKRTSMSRITRLDDIEEDAPGETETAIQFASNVDPDDLHRSSQIQSATQECLR